MAHVSSRDIDTMNPEQRARTLEELRDELLQLRAQQALGGSLSNSGSYKQTRRSIARLLTKINQEIKGDE
ncbi:50S ribosomal protein L29 [Euryarchaeota archaeon]|nr:50S ribosomal protein L29 [Euryarchaeota archaeon]|tara:strand:- start:1032 stop:1241 length:210 start_codon:yes stop_codon:yes gene_type:complete